MRLPRCATCSGSPKGMTLKASAAGLDLGGGKAVIIGNPATDGSERLFRAYGRVVDSLAGRFITAEDVGTSGSDMEMIRRETPWALGIPVEEGGSGDPSPSTGQGLMAALRAVAIHIWNDDHLHGRRVAVQGVGKVGGALVELLVDAGCEVVVSDINDEAVARRCRCLRGQGGGTRRDPLGALRCSLPLCHGWSARLRLNPQVAV